MSEFSLSNSSKTNKILSFFLLSCLFNMFFFIFLSTYLFLLFCSFCPLFFTNLFLLVLFPPNLHLGDDDDSRSYGSKLGFLLSVVESLVRKISAKNDENDEGIRCFDEKFLAYLDVFRETQFEEVLEGNCSESGSSGEEGRESKAHAGLTENKPNGNFDQNSYGKHDEDGKVEAARPIVKDNKFREKECNEVVEENFSSESGYSDNDGRESRNHVGPQEKVPSFTFDVTPFEKDKGNLEAAWPITEEEYNEGLKENFSEFVSSEEQQGRRSHVDLNEDPTVDLEEKPAGEEDDVEKVEKNTKLNDMFCQKRDKEVKPLDTDPNKAEESKDKITLRNGSKVMCNDSVIVATVADSEEEEEEEYFGTPERYWEYSRRIRRYGSMRKEKSWRRTLAFKLYEENNNVDDDDGRSGKSEAMDLLWETYEDIEHDKVKESTKSEANDEDEEGDDEKEEKEKGIEGKFCCLQALKLSAGKVNMGMRKPSLIKITKALKSIGFLHHHVRKHGRKKIH
ncbi:hypothetical protein QN277_024934 [Acacia crassicarpa]|uniref:Uncharacterized protein n=1 Tax=Acacia crassicarpa TaxID=499986 RepID=A0AAE1MHV3_9FABA|nr:hypothetical protein QN277_024934 [Acacia crassicarpa]